MMMVSNPKRLYKQEYAKQLFTIACGDYESAVVLSKSPAGRRENIIYLAQQGVEKAIKAVLVYLQIPFPLVHDLGILISHLPDTQLPPNGFQLTALSPYATVLRYEEGALPLADEEIHLALKATVDVQQWARQILSA